MRIQWRLWLRKLSSAIRIESPPASSAWAQSNERCCSQRRCGALCNCAALRAAPFTANLWEPLQQNAALDTYRTSRMTLARILCFAACICRSSILASQAPGNNVLDPVVTFDSTGIDVTFPCVTHTIIPAGDNSRSLCAAAGVEWWLYLRSFTGDSSAIVRNSTGLQEPRYVLIAALPWEPPTRPFRSLESIQSNLDVRACRPAPHSLECNLQEAATVAALNDGRLRLRIRPSANVLHLWRLRPSFIDVVVRFRGVPYFMSQVNLGR